MINSFRDLDLEDFFRNDAPFPYASTMLSQVFRKLELLDSAVEIKDFRSPPGNRFEALKGKLNGWFSVRVNKQYRLVFQLPDNDGYVENVYLDPHTYR